MLRKSRSITEDEEDEPRRSKFSEIGSRVEKMFRFAFKKEPSTQNQPKQKLESIDSDIEEAPPAIKSPPRREIVAEKAQALDSSDISEIDTGSHTNLVKIDKFEDEKVDKDKKNVNTRKNRQLRRSEHVRSNDLEQNSVDVVVDVHRENPEVGEATIESLSETELDKTMLQEVPTESKSDLKGEKSFESADSPKKQRKRWSKEAGVIKLPTRSSFSSSPSARSSPWRSANEEDTVVPVPAPRVNKIGKITDLEEDSDAGVDNAAFESDHDEVFKVRTDRKGSKDMIGMKSTENTSDSRESSPKLNKLKEIPTMMMSSPENRQKSVRKGKTLEDQLEIPTIGDESDSSEKIERKKVEKKTKKSWDKLETKKTRRKSLKSAESSDSEDYSPTGESSRSSSDKQHFKKTSRSSKDDGSSSENRKSARSAGKIKKIRKIDMVKASSRSMSSSHDSGDTSVLEKVKKSAKESEKIEKSARESEKTRKSAKKQKKPRKKKKEKAELKFTLIKIHKSDMLEADYVTRHPMVIVHIVDLASGNYLKALEGKENTGSFVQPLITGTFDFRENKSMIPHWDEELIFELDFETLLGTEKNQVLILFEVVDLPSFAEASQSYDQFGGENCWYKIAWAFLKPIGSSGVKHVDKVVRLQLYRPKRSVRKKIKHKCEVYTWWKSGSREKYPSSLYVSITPVSPPKLEPVYYGHLLVPNLSPSPPSPENVAPPPLEPMPLPKWSRLAAQSCKIPNELYFETEAAENGCFHVVFSNDGMFLACATSEEYDYPIVIYKVDEMKVWSKLLGHKSFVYTLDWSPDDDFLLSVSSDQTARIWDIRNKLMQHISLLPHPSYLYCGRFQTSSPEIVATGCFDRIIRVWSHSSQELIQELEGHEGFVTSLCFQKTGELLSSDSVGVIIQWFLKKSRRKSKKDWSISKKIKIRELEGVTINSIVLHPLGSRLLVHSRNNGLRILDLATGIVMMKYEGLKCLRIQTTARISPCGSLLLCGSEDGSLNVWHIETGKKVAVYQTKPKNLAVTCVDYHPYDHSLVYSTFGAPAGAVVLRFDKNSNGQNVGLQLLDSDQEYPIQSVYGLQPGVKSRRLSEVRGKSGRNGRSSEGIGGYDESREDLRKRLKMFSDAEDELKTKSANRLTNIIAKIDRILSNSSRSTYDVETGRTEIPMTEVPRGIPYVPPLFSTFEDNTSESKLSRSSRSSELLEVTTNETKSVKMTKVKTNRRNVKRKSKSAREIPEKLKNSEEEVGRAFSDGVVQFKGKRERIVESWTYSGKKEDMEHEKEKGEESSGDSGGTYVVDINRVNEEVCSVRSDVTFVVEHERKPPVPKPRKKSLVQAKGS